MLRRTSENRSQAVLCCQILHKNLGCSQFFRVNTVLSSDGRNKRKQRAVHFDDVSDLQKPGTKTYWFHAGSCAHGLKIRSAVEQKFLRVAPPSQTSVAPVFHG